MADDARVRHISHLQLNCRDFKASVAFYELLGFRVDRIIGADPDDPPDINDLSTVPLMRHGEVASYTLSLGLGDDPRAITRLELMQFVQPQKRQVDIPSEERLGMVRIAFTVAGLDGILARLREAGTETEGIEEFPVSPALTARYCHLYDPDRNWLTLTEWIRKDKGAKAV